METSYQNQTSYSGSIDAGYRDEENHVGDEKGGFCETTSDDCWCKIEEGVTINDVNKSVDETTCSWQYIYDEVW